MSTLLFWDNEMNICLLMLTLLNLLFVRFGG